MYVTYIYINIHINNTNTKEAVSPGQLHLTQKRVEDTLMKVPKGPIPFISINPNLSILTRCSIQVSDNLREMKDNLDETSKVFE